MPNNPTAQNRSAYDQIAARFAERNAAMLPYVIELGEKLLEMVKNTGSESPRLLDLGCGTGRDMAWFESYGAAVMGADLSMGMLTEARRIVKGALFQLDMHFLPFVSSSFAAVWCQAALLHIPKAEVPSALAEIRRLLAPRGLLHVSVQKGNTEGFETRAYEPVERFYAHYQADELFAYLRDAGFEVVHHGEAEARRSWIWAIAQKV